jgi:diphosphomevalonate decarboxylase
VFSGFVEWRVGAEASGMDSHAVPMEETWPDLRLGLVRVSDAPKSISSRRGMKRTRRTSALYEAWPVKVAHDMVMIKDAIAKGDFDQLGQVSESNALSMHATAIGAWPPVLYWLPESVAAMHKVWALRDDGMDLYFTMDAGPNVKLLFLAEDRAKVEQAFPGVDVVAPFGATPA